MKKRSLTTNIILVLLFWPFIIACWLFKYIAKEVRSSQQAAKLSSNHREVSSRTTSNEQPGLVKSEKGVMPSLQIPEPTKSLLWITDEDPSKIEHAGSINISISITDTGDVRMDQQQNGFYSEPSLIWTKLAIKPNTELATEAMYWPEYSRFYPETRYQYLNWLRDITQPTNLSYVFLYFYGLERHLLVGNYDGAVDEIIRLLQHHKKKSFQQYASRSLIIASVAKGRLDIIERAPFLLEEEIDEALALRIHKGTSMTPEDIIDIASKVGFTNKRYIKLHPELFKQELQRQIDKFESEHGKLLSIFNLEDFRREESSVFANMSIPEKVRTVKVPVILEDKKFSSGMRLLLQATHDNVKARLAAKKKPGRA